jgi:hypothetical protein
MLLAEMVAEAGRQAAARKDQVFSLRCHHGYGSHIQHASLF